MNYIPVTFANHNFGSKHNKSDVKLTCSVGVTSIEMGVTGIEMGVTSIEIGVTSIEKIWLDLTWLKNEIFFIKKCCKK